MGSLSDARTPSAPLRTPVSLLRAGGGGDRPEAACPPDCRPAAGEAGGFNAVQKLLTAQRALLLQDRTLGRARFLRANLSNRAAAPLTQLLQVTFGPETVIGEEFDLTNAEQVLIYGSWADRYHGTPGPPPNDVDVLVVGSPDRVDVYEAADRAQARLGMQVNPVIRTPEQWADDADSLVLQIKASPTVDVTPTGKTAS